MSKPIPFAGAVALLLLAACGSKEAATPGDNAAAAAGKSAPAGPVASEPGASGAANIADEAVSPPDAVSHPEGFLPPAPAEPGASPSETPTPPPATEDHYTRNGQ